MTALELNKFVEDNNLEYHYVDTGYYEKDVMLSVTPELLKDFAQLIKGAFDNGIMVSYFKYDGSIVFGMKSICDEHGIEIDEVFKEEEEK